MCNFDTVNETHCKPSTVNETVNTVNETQLYFQENVWFQHDLDLVL